MSPEAPGNLVVLDLRSEQDGFVCHVERYDPVDPNAGFLRVSWNAVSRPSGYESVAGGAAYVEVPPGFEYREYDAAPDSLRDRLGWIDKVFGDGLMLVVRLPYGFAVPGFRDAEPGPAAARHYPAGVRPDEALVGFHDLCALVRPKTYAEFRESFEGGVTEWPRSIRGTDGNAAVRANCAAAADA